MAYADYEFYASIYGDSAISAGDFSRLIWDAERMLDRETSGVDGAQKLRAAFPTDEFSAEAVRRCACKLVNLAHTIESAERAANAANGYDATENGLRGKVISSVSSGNESISYSTSGTASTLVDKAVSDSAARNKLYRDTIWECLAGVQDANGVNLLYMGPYPMGALQGHV